MIKFSYVSFFINQDFDLYHVIGAFISRNREEIARQAEQITLLSFNQIILLRYERHIL